MMNSEPFRMINFIFKAGLVVGITLFAAACGTEVVEPTPSPQPAKITPPPTTGSPTDEPTPITDASPEETICGEGLLSNPPDSEPAPQSPQISLFCQDGTIYYFHGSGFKPGEIPNFNDTSIISPFGTPMLLELKISKADGAGNLVLEATFSDIEPTGDWQINISANQGSKATGSFFYAPTQPRISLADQKSNEYGGITYVLLGTGWEPGEPLESIAENPSGIDQTTELIAEDVGSVIVDLPLAANPDDGDYITTISSNSHSVSIVITCKGGSCQPQEVPQKVEFSFARQFGNRFPDDYTSYTAFVTFMNDPEVINLDLPKSWSYVSGDPWMDEEVIQGVSLLATSDIDGFTGTYGTPGVVIIASSSQSDSNDEVGLLDGLDFFQDQCDYDDRYEYNDQTYSGLYDIYENCGQEGGSLYAVVLFPVDRDYFVFIQVQAVSKADLEALDMIIQSIRVTGDLP